MSEPDISTLARRLAEQNNVDWRRLGGSGPSGKVVERDVLDYLARVMAGMEAIDSTPEPLPEGVETWPDQDAPSRVHDLGNGDTDTGLAAEDALPEPDVAAEATEPAMASAVDGWSTAADAGSVADSAIDPVIDSVVDPAEDDLLSDDIFLFDSEEPSPAASSGLSQQTPFTADADEDADEAAAATTHDRRDEDATSPSDLLDEVDDLLLVEDEADGGYDEKYDDRHDAAAVRSGEQPTPDFGAASSDHGAPNRRSFSADVFGSDEISAPEDASADSFAEPSEVDADSWGVQPQPSDPFGFSDDTVVESTEDESLPDLWASEDAQSQESAEGDPFGADQPADAEGPWLSDHDAKGESSPLLDDAVASSSDSWHDGGGVAPLGDRWQDASHDEAPVSADAEVSRFDFEPPGDGDDPTTLEEAEHLDELDALEDVQALDGSGPELDVVAAVAALPLVRSGAVLRRHIDVSALAAAQLAVGLELGREPLEVAPFLLRAVARAAAELGITDGQVALAELKGGVTLRRIDNPESRTFRSLVEELEQDGSEEDEVGLVAVDLSALDVDEVVLDVAAPAVTLGRILYDTQHGAYRSTLALTGDLPMEKGAKLLGRVAQLLDAPVRLLL